MPHSAKTNTAAIAASPRLAPAALTPPLTVTGLVPAGDAADSVELDPEPPEGLVLTLATGTTVAVWYTTGGHPAPLHSAGDEDDAAGRC